MKGLGNEAIVIKRFARLHDAYDAAVNMINAIGKNAILGSLLIFVLETEVTQRVIIKVD